MVSCAPLSLQDLGLMEQAEVLRSMRLTMSEVMPTFRVKMAFSKVA